MLYSYYFSLRFSFLIDLFFFLFCSLYAFIKAAPINELNIRLCIIYSIARSK
nr:MAG TPA: hypothetical protein [Caudoviricetes sp.]